MLRSGLFVASERRSLLNTTAMGQCHSCKAWSHLIALVTLDHRLDRTCWFACLVGKSNENPTLDARSCQVEFPDGNVAECSANVIAENVFAMCDPDGNQQLLLEAVVDHKRDDSAVKHADRFVIVNG